VARNTLGASGSGPLKWSQGVQTDKAGDAPKTSARRPLARDPVTKRATVGCVGGLGDLATLPVATPPKGPSTPSALRNYAGPQHFCHLRGCDSAWVPGTVLGRPVRENEPSLPDRSWPHRASVTPLYYVTMVTSRANWRENTEAISDGYVNQFAEARQATTSRTGAAASR
jgi:hypothetical protein